MVLHRPVELAGLLGNWNVPPRSESAAAVMCFERGCYWQTSCVEMAPTHLQIYLEHFNQGVALLEYLETHMNRIYSCVRTTEEKAMEALVDHILKGDMRQGFAVRDVLRKHWSGLDSKEIITAALQSLYEMGWVVSAMKNSTKGGHPNKRLQKKRCVQTRGVVKRTNVTLDLSLLQNCLNLSNRKKQIRILCFADMAQPCGGDNAINKRNNTQILKGATHVNFCRGPQARRLHSRRESASTR